MKGWINFLKKRELCVVRVYNTVFCMNSINVLIKVGVLRNLGYIVWYFALICENSASANGNLDSSR